MRPFPSRIRWMYTKRQTIISVSSLPHPNAHSAIRVPTFPMLVRGDSRRPAHTRPSFGSARQGDKTQSVGVRAALMLADTCRASWAWIWRLPSSVPSNAVGN